MREVGFRISRVEILAAFGAAVGGQADQGVAAVAAEHSANRVDRRGVHGRRDIATIVRGGVELFWQAGEPMAWWAN